MPIIHPVDLCLMNLRGDFKAGQQPYLPKEEAYKGLKFLTGQDFGYDVRAWQFYFFRQKVKKLWTESLLSIKSLFNKD